MHFIKCPLVQFDLIVTKLNGEEILIDTIFNPLKLIKIEKIKYIDFQNNPKLITLKDKMEIVFELFSIIIIDEDNESTIWEVPDIESAIKIRNAFLHNPKSIGKLKTFPTKMIGTVKRLTKD